MPPYVPLVALNRSSKIRINGQTIPSIAQVVSDIDGYPPNDAEGPAYVDLGATSLPGTPVWKEVAYHASIGQVLVYGQVVNSLTIVSGLVASADGTDHVISLSAGTVRNVQTGATVLVPATTQTLSAASGVNPRIDTIQVNTTTGVVSTITGTPAASPVAPAPAAGNVALDHILVPTSAAATTQAQVTDVAPRS